MRALILLLALAACKNQEAAPAPALAQHPMIPRAELERGTDACHDYVTKICACTAPAAKDACALAKALPDAIEIGLQVAANPDAERMSVLQANDSIRKTIKECIEQVAKLPSLGC